MANFDKIAGYSPKFRPPKGPETKDSKIKRGARIVAAAGLIAGGAYVADDIYHNGHIDLSDYGVGGKLLKGMGVPYSIPIASAAENNTTIDANGDINEIIKKLSDGAGNMLDSAKSYLKGAVENGFYLLNVADAAVFGSTKVEIASGMGYIVQKGKQYSFYIAVTPDVTPLAGMQSDLQYNPAVLQVTSITEGNLFNQNGASTFFNSGTIDNVNGTVKNIFNVCIGRTNITDKGILVIVTANAINSGTSNINLVNTKISDSDAHSVIYDTINGSVTSYTPVPTPPPRRR